MFYVGSVSGASGTVSMMALPPGVKSIYLQGSASGIQWRMAVASGTIGGAAGGTAFAGPFSGGATNYASGYSGLGFVASGAVAYLDGPGLVSGPFRTVSNPIQCTTVVAVLNPGGLSNVSVLVFASPTS